MRAGGWYPNRMSPSPDAFASWHDFYILLGTASATLVGLLFVAASVSAGVFTSDRRAPLRVFLSACVVNFSLILASCLIVLLPATGRLWSGVMILAGGTFGLAHSGLALRDTFRDGLITAIDLEDRVWYIALPVVGYLGVAAAGVVLALRMDVGPAALAASVGLLLVIGIHNAWIITRRRG